MSTAVYRKCRINIIIIVLRISKRHRKYYRQISVQPNYGYKILRRLQYNCDIRNQENCLQSASNFLFFFLEKAN